MKDTPHADLGRTYWYAYRVFIPDDWQWDSEAVLITQWHGYPDRNLGETWRCPPLSLQMANGSNGLGRNYVVRLYADSRRITPACSAETKYPVDEKHEIGAVTEDLGRWIDWVFKVRWSFRNDGHITIWKNGHVLFEYAGPTTFNDELGPFMKFGIYEPVWKDKTPSTAVAEHHLYFDDIRIGGGKAVYRDVAPNPSLVSAENSSEKRN
jgi:hypothetical protein